MLRVKNLDWCLVTLSGAFGLLGKNKYMGVTKMLHDCLAKWWDIGLNFNFEPNESPTWTFYQIHKLSGWAPTGNAGNVFPADRLQGNPRVSNPAMHHGTCVMCVSWCMSGSLTRSGRENVPGIPGACATRNFTHLLRGPLPVTRNAVPNRRNRPV